MALKKLTNNWLVSYSLKCTVSFYASSDPTNVVFAEIRLRDYIKLFCQNLWDHLCGLKTVVNNDGIQKQKCFELRLTAYKMLYYVRSTGIYWTCPVQ